MAKILVVDDSRNIRTDVSEYLISQGIDVITAVDGEDGFEKIRQNPGLKLVMCDVNMPNMDGMTMVEKVRSVGNQICFIMLTTEDDRALKDRGKAMGVKGWIVKPFNGPSVIHLIKRIIE